MLNAFRHHRSHHGWPCQGHHSTGSPVLNAFRHHRSHHTARTPTTCTRSPSAQRLSASQISSPPTCRRGTFPAASAQRLSASQISSQATEAHQKALEGCSTPFGITDLITRRRPRGSRLPFRAQRLSASQISSRPRTLNFPFKISSAQRLSASQISSLRRSERRESGWACSTPFGITDLITVARPTLPASRSSAQRLSASQISSQLGDHPTSANSRSAQRLSASQISSLAIP